MLGLVTTKTGGLETEAVLRERLKEAAGVIDRERLVVGTQCGFATSLGGNAITTADERRKLALVGRTAQRFFG